MNKLGMIAFSMVTILLSASIAGAYILIYETMQDRRANDAAMQFHNTSMYANGVYFGGRAFCVVLDGRSEQEIMRTTCHEVCHAEITRNYSHFCE
jgi:hypothetical protein